MKYPHNFIGARKLPNFKTEALGRTFAWSNFGPVLERGYTSHTARGRWFSPSNSGNRRCLVKNHRAASSNSTHSISPTLNFGLLALYFLTLEIGNWGSNKPSGCVIQATEVGKWLAGASGLRSPHLSLNTRSRDYVIKAQCT